MLEWMDKCLPYRVWIKMRYLQMSNIGIRGNIFIAVWFLWHIFVTVTIASVHQSCANWFWNHVGFWNFAICCTSAHVILHYTLFYALKHEPDENSHKSLILPLVYSNRNANLRCLDIVTSRRRSWQVRILNFHVDAPGLMVLCVKWLMAPLHKYHK